MIKVGQIRLSNRLSAIPYFDPQMSPHSSYHKLVIHSCNPTMD